MSRSKAKMHKTERLKKDAELRKNGRTERQVKIRKMKQAIKDYLIQNPGFKFPPTFSIDLKYYHMHRLIANENKRLREEAEARRLEEEKSKAMKELEQQDKLIDDDIKEIHPA